MMVSAKSTQLFNPKALKITVALRQVSWLAEVDVAFPSRLSVTVAKRDNNLFCQLTVAGTASVLHGIPFSFTLPDGQQLKPLSGTKVGNGFLGANKILENIFERYWQASPVIEIYVR